MIPKRGLLLDDQSFTPHNLGAQQIELVADGYDIEASSCERFKGAWVEPTEKGGLECEKHRDSIGLSLAVFPPRELKLKCYQDVLLTQHPQMER